MHVVELPCPSTCKMMPARTYATRPRRMGAMLSIETYTASFLYDELEVSRLKTFGS